MGEAMRTGRTSPILRPAPADPTDLRTRNKQGGTTMRINTSAKKLKVTLVLDPRPFAALRAIPDSAPPRTEIIIGVDGQSVKF
jgi:hypothetical protein